MSFSTYREALEWLESHVDFERVAPNRAEVPTLEPVRQTLLALADPHRDYPAIHLTGTNGKGTTTTLVSALLGGTGLRVGTFTSPDLHAVNERIAVNGGPIADEDFTSVLGRLADVESVTGIRLTRFELLTTAALLHFSDEGVDVAVVEVGMGGTWDSTNVIDGSVSVLTNVDLDHTAVLGDTVDAIAHDKVGIFRTGGIAVVGTRNEEVVSIADARARDIGSELALIGRDFQLEHNDLAVGGRLLSVRTPFSLYEDVLLSLHGIHQGVNAAVALAAVEFFLDRAIGEDVVREVFGSASMPGRLELLSRSPMVVVDGGHNPAGMRALAASLDGAFHVDGVRRCVVGMLTGRDVDDMVAPLVESGIAVFYVSQPQSPRAMDRHVVADAIRRAGGVAHLSDTCVEALQRAREESGPDDLIVAAGSLYLVAEVRGSILGIASRHLS